MSFSERRRLFEASSWQPLPAVVIERWICCVHLCIFAAIRCPHVVGCAHARSLDLECLSINLNSLLRQRGHLTIHFTSLLFILCSYHLQPSHSSRASPRIVFPTPAPLFCMACLSSLLSVSVGQSSLCVCRAARRTTRQMVLVGRYKVIRIETVDDTRSVRRQSSCYHMATSRVSARIEYPRNGM